MKMKLLKELLEAYSEDTWGGGKHYYTDDTKKIEFKVFQQARSREWSVVKYVNGKASHKTDTIQANIATKKEATDIAKKAAEGNK